MAAKSNALDKGGDRPRSSSLRRRTKGRTYYRRSPEFVDGKVLILVQREPRGIESEQATIDAIGSIFQTPMPAQWPDVPASGRSGNGCKGYELEFQADNIQQLKARGKCRQVRK